MNFHLHAGKGDDMLNELASELGLPENRKLAFRIMRSTLRVLRNSLNIDDSLQLIMPLPFIIKALYVDGWQFQKHPNEIKSVKDFVREVIHEDYPQGHHDFQTAKDGENAVKAVFKVLINHINDSELKTMKSIIPESIHSLLDDNSVAVN